MPDNEQYIAVIKIEKRTSRDVPLPNLRPGTNPGKETKRDVAEVTQMTIKAATLEKVVEKTRAHLALIEED